jgi:hypothetical protein
MSATRTRYQVCYRFDDGPEHTAVVALTEGYTTFGDIPTIIAVRLTGNQSHQDRITVTQATRLEA